MITNKIKLRQQYRIVAYTLLAISIITIVITAMIVHMYDFSKQESYERLHLETRQLKVNINHQMISDRENLITMSNFASELHSNGKGFQLLFDSFEEIGLFEKICILTADNNIMLKNSTIPANGKINFEEEISKGTYVSGKVKDFVTEDKDVVRSAVPIVSKDGDIIAMLYGIINLTKFEDRYSERIKNMDADFCIIEGGNGNYIADTRSNVLGNITGLATSQFAKGYSYEMLIDDLTNSHENYSAFMSSDGKNFLYAHYSPLDISDWQILLSQPEDIVFASGRNAIKYMLIASVIILLVMLFYIVIIMTSERRVLKINAFASQIRKKLLELNQKKDKINEALKDITAFSHSRSSFIIDTYSEDYHYINPSFSNKLLSGEDRKVFISKILAYAARHRKKHGAELYLSEIKCNKQLYAEMPDFYKFLKTHEIKLVCFAVIINNNSNTNILGVINPKSSSVAELLKEIAVCFSMALYNKRYLTKTETQALTDSLTGVENRMAYTHDIQSGNINITDTFVCIYIDVNELHYFNSKYGHAAGDQMLCFIAEELKKAFPYGHIYRMGGDEFLIFADGLSYDEIKAKIETANTNIEEMKYHVSIGIKYGKTFNIENAVTEAEKMMYDEKAKYYQNKEQLQSKYLKARQLSKLSTGIKQIDACLAVMSERFLGVFCVSHTQDTMVSVLSPSYFSEIYDKTGVFSETVKQYIYEIAKPEFHRTMLNFLEYGVIETHLRNGHIPKVSYTKVDGENVTLYICPVSPTEYEGIDSVWIFEKDE